MSKYTRNAVYSYVHDKIKTSYPNAYVSGMYEPVVPSFPAVFIREVGKFSNTETVTLSGVQGVWTSTFEVQIQSNKADTPLKEVYGILEVVQAAFSSIYYLLTAVNDVGTADADTFRVVATFRKVNGEADEIPSSQSNGG